MSVAVITGAAGLVGSEAVRYFSTQGMTVVGIDNGMRKHFFGEEASTDWQRDRLVKNVPSYRHLDIDIRDSDGIFSVFREYGRHISLVVHAAAQPSHDWAARDPFIDFTVNANGTSVMLEATRRVAPDAAFIFTSTNKVYGDRPNLLPLLEKESRWELDSSHPYALKGIPESMSIDATKHSLFGASKVAEAISICERVVGRPFSPSYKDEARSGDHIWWVSDTSTFEQHYPDWRLEYNIPRIIQGIFEANAEMWGVHC